MSTQETGYKGFQSPENSLDEYNALLFLVRQLLSDVDTATIVQVTSVTNTGGAAAVGFVDVQPLINQQDGFGNSIPHGVLHNLPYLRIQGGKNAVILDPQVDDIGIAIFANRDISTVKNSATPGNPALGTSTQKGNANNPGSQRQFSMADGMYLGGILNGVPTQYVEFTQDGSGNPNGIKLVSPTSVTIQAPAVNLQNSGSALETLLNSTLLTWLENHVHTGNLGSPTSTPTTTPPSTVETTITKAE